MPNADLRRITKLWSGGRPLQKDELFPVEALLRFEPGVSGVELLFERVPVEDGQIAIAVDPNQDKAGGVRGLLPALHNSFERKRRDPGRYVAGYSWETVHGDLRCVYCEWLVEDIEGGGQNGN